MPRRPLVAGPEPGVGNPLPCGNSTVYCPAHAVVPLPAGSGYYTTGGVESTRVQRTLCREGQYCPGDGFGYDCPLGRFGATEGLDAPFCSGPCDDGVLCGAGSVSPTGSPCPAGAYCLQGVPVPCLAGTYNPREGASSVASCVLCSGGTFNPSRGAASPASCVACAPLEGSGPGASGCWPGLRGTVELAQPPAFFGTWELTPSAPSLIASKFSLCAPDLVRHYRQRP